ncbi:hypothetical protein ACQ4PT_058538 [Festuca glaucescens]
MQHEAALRRSAPSPTPAKEAIMAFVPSQSTLAKEVELIHYELQGCLTRVGRFLARAEAILGRLPAIPVVTPLAEPHVGPVGNGEVELYGPLSPRGRPCMLSLPAGSSASESEAIVGVVAPVLHIMPEVQELCEEPALPLSMVHPMVDSLEASAVPLSLAPPLSKPSQTLAFVKRECLDDVVLHSTQSIGKVVSVGDEVVASSALPPIPGALFAKKLCDFHVSLEADDPGSGKTIGCLLKEREMRNKSKEGSRILKEKSFKSKIKKSGASNGPDKFTVSLEHNGFFCGLRENLCYVSGTADYFDNCSMDTFSRLWIEDFIRRLGTDTIVQRKAPLPPVMSPKKVVKRRRDAEEASTSSSVTNVQGDDDEQGDDDDDETDSEFYDLDYDAEDGDDDIFEAHIDKDVDDHNEKQEIVEQEDDAGLENEDINLTSEQLLQLKYKFSTFNAEVDFENPQFKIGMLFSSMKEFRNDLTVYSIRNRAKLRKIRNTAARIHAICCEGCTRFIKASEDSRKEAIVVKKYEPKHTCESIWELKVMTAPFLTQIFMDEFRDNQKMNLPTFANKIQRKFNMCPNRFKLGRARKEALAIIHGDEAEQFEQLRDYGHEMKRANPGSTFFLSTNYSKDNDELEPKEHLATLYWSSDACKRGFLKGCRPIICIDGYHIKTKYKGQLLTAVGIDANDCIFPIAFGLGPGNGFSLH